MPRPPSSARATCLASLLVLGLLCPWACKRSVEPPPPTASASPPRAPAEEASRCRRQVGFELTIGAPPNGAGGSVDPAGQETDDEAVLPFGVALGNAAVTASGFAVAGLEGGGLEGGAKAFVALLKEHGSRRVELGQVHGDPEPPALASYGERVIAVVGSSDAAGHTLRLAQLPGAASTSVEWGSELSGLGKAVASVGLALSQDRALVVFEAEEKGKSRVFLATFSISDVRQPLEPKAIEHKDIDSPRITARAGGFWLAWVRTLPEPKKTGRAAATDAEDPEERAPLEFGLRVVEVVQLDPRGVLVGAPVRLGEPRRSALLFDLAPVGDGGLLFASRFDGATPGAEAGAILLNRVGPDGSVQEERLDDDELGVGAPLLLSDRPTLGGGATGEESKAPLAEPLLVLSSPSDATRFGVVRGQRTELLSDPGLGGAELMAVKAGRFLTQRARGRSVELSVLACQPGK